MSVRFAFSLSISYTGRVLVAAQAARRTHASHVAPRRCLLEVAARAEGGGNVGMRTRLEATGHLGPTVAIVRLGKGHCIA